MVKVSNYVFKNDKYIKLALTHSSYSSENYERLEFLGDSILDFVVAKYFFDNTDQSEGNLTKLRSHFVSADNLSVVFDNLNVSNLVLLGKSCKELTKSIKCDMFEAIVAAVYLDSNLEVCEKFILNNIFIENINQIELLDSKSKLQEWAQANKMSVTYTLIEQKGESHNPTFTVEAKVGEYSQIATENAKQIAEQKAAKQILDILLKEKK